VRASADAAVPKLRVSSSVAAASLVRVDATRPDAELGCRCILRHTGGEFFVDAPGTVFPISFEDTGSGVFATAVAAIVLGLGPLGASAVAALRSQPAFVASRRCSSTSTSTELDLVTTVAAVLMGEPADDLHTEPGDLLDEHQH